MELTQAQLKNLQSLNVNSSTLKTANLVTGQQVQAKVTAINTQTGEVTLQISNNNSPNKTSSQAPNQTPNSNPNTPVTVTVKTQLSSSLTTGQNLQLTVSQVSADKITLQPQPALINSLANQKILQEALREALPKQQPISHALIELKSLLNKLSSQQNINQSGLNQSSLNQPSLNQPKINTLSQDNIQGTNKQTTLLSNNVTQLIKIILNKLPTPTLLGTASGVKHAIQQSGVFLEAKLSNAAISDTINTSIINKRKTTENGTNNNPQNPPQSRLEKTTINHDLKALFLNLKSALVNEKNTASEAISLLQTLPKNSKLLTLNNQEALLKKILDTDTTKRQSTNTSSILNSDRSIRNENQIKQQYEKILLLRTTEEKNTALTKILNENLVDKKWVLDQFINNQAISNQLEKSNLSDKQILQIISLIFNRKSAKKTNNQSAPPLTTQNSLAQKTYASPTQTSVFKASQQYANKTHTQPNELALGATKSQHISEAVTPKINNLMDLIETLIKQVDSAISRTQVHQLNALQDQESGKLAMSLEIPVNDEDNLHLVKLHIEKEPSKEEEIETVVTVNLAVDLNKIGPIYARIILIKDNTSVVLWAERDETFTMVKNNVDKLHNKLEKSGLKSDNISCHHGQPPQAQFIKTDSVNSLLDVKV